MVTGAMSETEVTKELRKDFKDLMLYSDRNFDKKFRRDVIHTDKFPIHRRYTWLSRSKNPWTVIYEARGKRDVGDRSRVTFFVTSEGGIGKYVYMPTFVNGSLFWIIFPPHFFSRYNERCGVGRSGQALYDLFFKSNASFVFELKDVVSEDGQTMTREVYGSTADGVAMGVMTVEGNVLFRTFVTYAMLKGEQVEKYTKNEEVRKEIHERYMNDAKFFR